jgi:N-acetylneuraminic acid mutarotase
MDVSWDQLPDLPTPLPKTPCAVYLNSMIYVGGASTKDHAHTIFVYNPEQPESWSELTTKCPRKNFGMAAVDNILVIVGGVDSAQKRSNKVTVWDPTAQQWKEGYYPSLVQARASPHVMLYKRWLLVIGGTAEKTLSAIEKLDVDSNKPWAQCPPLPNRCADISSVIVEHTLYVAGIAVGTSEPGKVVYSVLLPLLVRIRAKDNTVWDQLPNIPNTSASLCSITRKSILAFGGEVELMSSISSMLSPMFTLKLHEAGTKWERVGSLPFERNCCTCLRVGGNKVVLLGGSQQQAAGGVKRVDVVTLQGLR